MAGIITTLPSMFVNLWNELITNGNGFIGIVTFVVFVLVFLAIVVGVVFEECAERRIPIQYANKSTSAMGNQNYIPFKLNGAGVMPVIFAVSIMQFPIIVSSFFGVKPARAYFWPKVLYMLNQGNWFNVKDWGEFKYTVGVILYLVLLVFFAYFYTSITFNPNEVSQNMKKQGGFIPGIRPGRPTTEYLTKVLNYIVLIGAIGLAIVALLPLILCGIFSVQVSFGATSIIIIVGVVLETLNQIESMMLVRHYKGFLND
jgi:preprotein translocase subunit SecY